MTTDERIVATASWLILGCGYTGRHVATRLAESGAAMVLSRRAASDARDEVNALRLRVEGARVEPAAIDLSRPDELDRHMVTGGIVVVSAPPRDTVDGERAIVRAAKSAGVRRVVYISSTGVYPPSDGGWVDESTPPAPASAHGKRRLAAESALLDEAQALGVEAVSLRAAGIYGPGRGVAARMRKGNYRVVGAGDTYVNRIHVRDLATAVIAAALTTPLAHRVYNVADGDPRSSRDCADQVVRALGLAPPPVVDLSDVSPMARAMLGANRRIDVTRLRQQLGVLLRYPTFADALAAGDV